MLQYNILRQFKSTPTVTPAHSNQDIILYSFRCALARTGVMLDPLVFDEKLEVHRSETVTS